MDRCYLEVEYELRDTKNNSRYQCNIQLYTIYPTRGMDDAGLPYTATALGKNSAPCDRYCTAGKCCCSGHHDSAISGIKHMAWCQDWRVIALYNSWANSAKVRKDTKNKDHLMDYGPDRVFLYSAGRSD